MIIGERLTKFVAAAVADRLAAAGAVDVPDPRRIAGLVEGVISSQMDIEKEIDEETGRILAEHYQQVRAAGASYDELFRMIKKKLAEERGVVI